MYKSALTLIFATSLSACGGSENNETATGVIDNVTEIVEVVDVTPTLDHSGLTPLTREVIDNSEYFSGGEASTTASNKDAFSIQPPAIASDFQLGANFTLGDHIFRTPDDNIGPILITGSCQGCHLNDGRGVVPATPTTPMSSMLIKLADSTGAADPIYGDQIQPFSVQSFSGDDFTAGYSQHDGSVSGTELLGEAFPFVEFEIITGEYPDGTPYQLRKPTYKIRDLSYGAFVDDIHFSARVAPQAFGVGLLGAIPQENLLNLVDESDRDKDGISGRASMVTDAVLGDDTADKVIGRFAYKAQNPSVLQQVSSAFGGDMGLSTSVFSHEPCTDLQLACLLATEKESKVEDIVDISDYSLALVEFYNRVLSVPVRRGYDTNTATWDTDISAGRTLFFEANCVGCHTPRHVTGEAKGSVLGELSLTRLSGDAEPIAVLSQQTIYPYTDLLLHDMGGSCEVTRETTQGLSCSSGAECLYVQRCEGLADGVIQGDASGSEWKTPALWGLGLVQTVNADSSFLHDGRARTIEEAVLWHDGEAATAKAMFMNYSADERQQLLLFLQSL